MRNRVGVLAALVIVAACGGDEDARTRQAARDSAATARPAAPTLSEPQLVMAVLVADAADSAAGAVARERADAEAVRSFARSMVNDHSAINEQLTALAAQLGLQPAESSLSNQLGARGRQSFAQLQETPPSAFDSAYIAAEIAAHSVFLNALDRHVVPSALNADLKQTVQNIRRAVAVHLAVAQRVQAELRSAAAAAAAPRPAPADDAVTAPAETAPRVQTPPQPLRPADTTRRTPPPRDTVIRIPPPRIDTVLPPVKDTLRGR